MKISFIGFGHMAKAIAHGLLQHKQQHWILRAAAPSLPIGISDDGIETHPDNCAILSDADVILLGVKPALIQPVLQEIRPHLNTQLILSLAAGVSLEAMMRNLPDKTAIIRAMPNIAATVSESLTPLVANSKATSTQRQQAQAIFEAVGRVLWVNHEEDINSLTALSGSGPAYVFLFMEALAQAGIHFGLSDQTATMATLQTIKGACELALTRCQCLTDLEHLRNTVTSPGGTTSAAIEVFLQQEFSTLVLNALSAARDRAHALNHHKDSA